MGENFKSFLEWLKSPAITINGNTQIITGKSADKYLELQKLKKELELLKYEKEIQTINNNKNLKLIK